MAVFEEVFTSKLNDEPTNFSEAIFQDTITTGIKNTTGAKIPTNS
jgi:hypothetical protein